MAVEMLPPYCGLAGHTSQKAKLGQRVEVYLGTGARFIAVYAQIATQSTTAATDIVAWDTTSAGCIVSADTSAYTAEIAGLPITGGDATFTIGEFAWIQTWGSKITMPDGTVIGNTLLGDGSVANKEALMAASTDGMVDTYSGALLPPIGVAFEDDAPAIALFLLSVYPGAM